MTEPYVRASELKDFVFCRRAWFLERQGIPTTLTDARELPWQTLLALIRLATNSRAAPQPLSAAQGCATVDCWLQHPNITILTNTDRFWPILREQLLDSRITGPLATVAALALEHSAVLCSTNRDLRRFRRSCLSTLEPRANDR